MTNNEMDRFKQTFITECHELLDDMEQLLLSLDEASVDLETVNAIFRCAHSIKGGAGGFGYKRLSQVTHVLETLLDILRDGKALLNQAMIDALLSSVDILKTLVAAAQNNKEMPEDYGHDVVTCLEELVLEQVQSGNLNLAAGGVQKTKDEDIQTEPEEVGIYEIDFIPVSHIFKTGNEPTMILRELAKLGKMTVETDFSRLPDLEEMDPQACYLSWHISLETDQPEEAIAEAFEFVEDECEYHIHKIGAIVKEQAKPKLQKNNSNIANDRQKTQSSESVDAQSVSTIRVDIEKVDRLVNLVGELVITQSMLMVQTRDMPVETFPKLIEGVSELAQHTRELQEAVMSVRMQPVKSVFSRMPRIVRDLSRKLEKDIALKMVGENTEVDKTVVEQLTDPLTHMIRNSVDHGIDKPEQRIKEGKPAQGKITLSAEHRGGRIVISVEDDGNGINRERVLAKAKEKNIVAQDAELSNEEIDKLIFAPGFSTAETVSDISGRGVGMDVVRRNIELLGGFVSVENKEGHGTKFTISLPLTLAILDGMIVRIGHENYIIPISHIIETLRPSAMPRCYMVLLI